LGKYSANLGAIQQMTTERFDWWRALAQVLGSIEAVRDGRAMYVLLGAFAGAGTVLAMARSALGDGNNMSLAVLEGALGLFIAFYGSQAAGLLLMDRAQGRPAREVFDAVMDALGVAHRVLVALLVMWEAGRQPLFWFVLAFSVALSHAPGRVRHHVLIPGPDGR